MLAYKTSEKQTANVESTEKVCTNFFFGAFKFGIPILLLYLCSNFND
ncbi:hypothetical protein PI172_1670 [Prevotella intermedia]|uniref:Uncharacterized protein n=1 Tax=Prevotella intermedia TaxID=28131 RepID=A0AAD1BJF4_PREIN|nr:hypothetical protein PIN17_A1008 [Prevotella intermedia 17]BAR96398.1 hypothetical protein PI172_1670 [Prevotella intermedia]